MASIDLDNAAMITQTPISANFGAQDVQRQDQDDVEPEADQVDIDRIGQMPRAGPLEMFGDIGENMELPMSEFDQNPDTQPPGEMLDTMDLGQNAETQEFEKQKIQNLVREQQVKQQELQDIQATKYVEELANIGQLGDLEPRPGLDNSEALKNLTDRREQRFDAIMKMISESDREFDAYKKKYASVMTKHVITQPTDMLNILQTADTAASKAKHGIHEATKFIMDYDAFIFAPPDEPETDLVAKITKQHEKQQDAEKIKADDKGRAGLDLAEFEIPPEDKEPTLPDDYEDQQNDYEDQQNDDDDLLNAVAAGSDVDDDMLDQMDI